jgi:hypothetical protein
MQNNKIYIVTMYRWGNKENHSYVIGAFTDSKEAVKAGISHSQYRDGKYDPEIIEVDLNRVYYEDGSQIPNKIVSLKY